MKRVVLFCIVAMVLVVPVMAQVSPIKVTFQGTTPVSAPAVSYPFYLYEGHFNATGFSSISSPNTNGAQIVGLSNDNLGRYGVIRTVNNELFEYAAWTESGDANGGDAKQLITLYYHDGSTAWAVPSMTGPLYPTYGRWEIVMAGGTAYIYLDDVLKTSKALTQNPAGISISGQSGGWSWPWFNYDDFVFGYGSDATVIGTIPPNYFILYNSAAPASTGLYRLNATTGGSPVLINSNTFGLSYGRANPAGTTLNLINPSGTIVKSYPVNNMSAQLIIPILDLMSGGSIQNGMWSVSLADDAETSYFWVLTEGASVSWNSNTYSPGDIATVSWIVSDGKWDTNNYFYRLKIVDIYGTEKVSQSITSQTGSITREWTSLDANGVYYAEVFRSPVTSPNDLSLLNYDATTLVGTFPFHGYVYDAETTNAIAGVSVNMTQIGSSHIYTTGASGDYSTSAIYLTGGVITVNVSKSGYTPYLTSFTPTSARNTSLDFTLLSTSPTFVGLALGGIDRDGTYHNPVSGSTVTVTNGSDVHTILTNSRGYYLVDNNNLGGGSYLTPGTCYTVKASKAGYSDSPDYFKCLVAS